MLRLNKITELKDGDFKMLTECRDLDLEYNLITTVGHYAFRGMTKLMHLKLGMQGLLPPKLLLTLLPKGTPMPPKVLRTLEANAFKGLIQLRHRA